MSGESIEWVPVREWAPDKSWIAIVGSLEVEITYDANLRSASKWGLYVSDFLDTELAANDLESAKREAVQILRVELQRVIDLLNNAEAGK